MPSPRRSTDSSSVAYTRWEPLEHDDRDSLTLPFEHFQEEGEADKEQQNVASIASRLSGLNPNSASTSSHKRSGPALGFSNLSRDDTCWLGTVRALCVLIIFGLGWIFGFLVRWGIHTHYIDPLGHCTVPKSYSYNPATVRVLMDSIDSTNIEAYFNNFTGSNGLDAEDENGDLTEQGLHSIGSDKSQAFANYIEQQWNELGLINVHQEHSKVFLPTVNERTSTIVIQDAEGKEILRQNLTAEENGIVGFVHSGTGSGQLVYGHYGSFDDLTQFTGYNISDSVVMLRVSRKHEISSRIRNVERFGARAVIAFPDIFYLNETNTGDEMPINFRASYFSGDPNSIYADPDASMPRIPVISISHSMAMRLLKDYTNAYKIPESMAQDLDMDPKEMKQFRATVELKGDVREQKLHNVLGSIPGLYEPTRYVLITSHHDTWLNGDSRTGLAHAVLMELVRAIATLFEDGWFPGRSIIFASWDGHELGHLGETFWLQEHVRELSSRAVAVINLEYELFDSHSHFTASPLLRKVIDLAAQSVPCKSSHNASKPHDHSEDEQEQCTLFEEWVKRPEHHLKGFSSTSPFLNQAGVSTLDIAVDSLQPDLDVAAAAAESDQGVVLAAQQFVSEKYAYSERIARFAAVVIFQLTTTPELPLLASDYVDQIQSDLLAFCDAFQFELETKKVDREPIAKALSSLDQATQRFHNNYNDQDFLVFLGYHEYSDQLLEMERAMLLPSAVVTPSKSLLATPNRHVIYGPSPLDRGSVQLFPRLTAALKIARAEATQSNWKQVNKELAYVVEALNAAACVLDNHIVHKV